MPNYSVEALDTLVWRGGAKHEICAKATVHTDRVTVEDELFLPQIARFHFVCSVASATFAAVRAAK